ncbi:MAG: molybdopterin-binding protein [Deltaproteobacteria bacterium]|nr:molybdopterin-binding protein [Deltaproteobacteria bacterium]
MKLREIPVDEAVGYVLLHRFVGPDGKTVAGKGKRLEASDVAALRSAGAATLRVAELEADDVREDDAALELTELLAGPGLTSSTPTGGRVDLSAATPGLFTVDVELLLEVNSLQGLAVAAARHRSTARAGQRLASVKIVPYAIPRATLGSVRGLCRGGPIFSLKDFSVRSAMLLTVGPDGSREELAAAFDGSLRERLGAFGIEMAEGPHTGESEREIADALRRSRVTNPEMILIAGAASVADTDDLTPRALRAVGGQIVEYGIPTEPGSLLLLAYWGDTPVVGLPGCVRSTKLNGFDLVLPRLAAGERLSAADLAEIGHGGLLD